MNPGQKYNRTFHLPWSKGVSNDDKIIESISSFINTPIVISEKLDGSNTSLENKGCFSRSHSGPPTHESFDEFKVLHATVKHKIPEQIQLFGEWLYALHSIEYNELPAYFMLFNVRDILTDEWLSWEDVEMWAEEVEVPTVPVLFKGTVSSEKEFKELTESFMIQPSLCGGIREGVVVRVASNFSDNYFASNVAKCVRKDHVTTSTHWIHQKIVKNKLKILI